MALLLYLVWGFPSLPFWAWSLKSQQEESYKVSVRALLIGQLQASAPGKPLYRQARTAAATRRYRERWAERLSFPLAA